MNKFFLVVMVLFSLPLVHANANESATHQIDEIFSDWENSNTPGFAVKISQEQETVYENYFGLASLEHKTNIAPDTRFQIASVSKQFTAFAIAQLATQKKIKLDNDIREYLPEMPIYSSPITVLHLLHHTSGLRDLDDLYGLIGTGESDYKDTSEIYKLIVSQRSLNFEPGERFDYSNTGYVLLAKIVEHVTGMSFRDYMHTHVFSPIGMKHTVVLDNAFEVIEKRATAYYSNDNQFFTRDNMHGSVYGSSGIYTSLTDLDLWARNFSIKKAGNDEIFKLMKTTGRLKNGDNTNYAFGQELKNISGYEAIFHGGGLGAYRAYLIRFPELSLSITFVANNSYTTFHILDYVDKLTTILLPENARVKHVKEARTQSVSVSPSTLSKYVGDYQLQPGLIFSITQIEDSLRLIISGQNNKIDLDAQGQNKFVLTDTDNGYFILFDEDDEASNFIRYYQGDFEYIGERINLVDFDPSIVELSKYEGIYYSQELNTVYKISNNNGVLTATQAKNAPIRLEPFQPDTFVTGIPFFQEVTFVSDSDVNIKVMKVSGARSKDIVFEKVSELRNTRGR
jgi:CubicO group peptidase (beta-lactamase class C family)